MFLLLVLASTFLLGLEYDPLDTAANRQEDMKLSHFHRALEKSEVRPGINALKAAADQLVMEKPRVDDQYLRSWMDNTVRFLMPQNYGVEIVLSWSGQDWEENYRETGHQLENRIKEGSILMVVSGGKIVNVNYRIRMFEVDI